MNNPTQTVKNLIKTANPKSGASPHEAHTAATLALQIALKNNLKGHLIAKCRNLIHRASARCK